MARPRRIGNAHDDRQPARVISFVKCRFPSGIVRKLNHGRIFSSREQAARISAAQFRSSISYRFSDSLSRFLARSSLKQVIQRPFIFFSRMVAALSRRRRPFLATEFALVPRISENKRGGKFRESLYFRHGSIEVTLIDHVLRYRGVTSKRGLRRAVKSSALYYRRCS